MSCTCYYHRLWDIIRVQVLPDLGGGFVPIHEGHLTVHQDQVIATPPDSDQLSRLDDHIYCLPPVVGKLALGVCVNQGNHSKNDHQRIDVKRLVVDHKDFL